MIVLDEHLSGAGIAEAIGHWYRGRVALVTELRPGSVIKDDAVPALLRTLSDPTFVTIDWTDFWLRTKAHPNFCLVCFTLPTRCALEIAPLLRRLFRLAPFRTKAARLGKIVRVSEEHAAYYQVHDTHVHLQPLP
jgi:hypothetical protein